MPRSGHCVSHHTLLHIKTNQKQYLIERAYFYRASTEQAFKYQAIRQLQVSERVAQGMAEVEFVDDFGECRSVPRRFPLLTAVFWGDP